MLWFFWYVAGPGSGGVVSCMDMPMRGVSDFQGGWECAAPGHLVRAPCRVWSLFGGALLFCPGAVLWFSTGCLALRSILPTGGSLGILCCLWPTVWFSVVGLGCPSITDRYTTWQT